MLAAAITSHELRAAIPGCQDDISVALLQLLQQVKGEQVPIPLVLLHQLRQVHDQYNGWFQHDAHELLTRLLEAAPRAVRRRFQGTYHYECASRHSFCDKH